MKEIIRMNQLAGLITESQAKKMMAVADKKAALKNKRSLKENESSNKYVSMEVEDGEEYPALNKKAISDYLKSVIDPKQVRAVGTFMNDQEGYGEAAGNFFTGEGDESVTEKEVEDWATMEMSYYLNSSPDEFPFKKRSMNEAEKQLPKVGDKITDEGKEFQVISVDKNFIDVKSLKNNKTYHFSSKSWITNYPPVSAHIAEDSPKARILTNVYYIGDNAEGDLAGLAGSAVPAYDLPGYSLRQIEDEGDGMLYMKKGEIGWYDGRIFESELENSTTAVDKKYIELL
jgi:hypothetical protein